MAEITFPSVTFRAQEAMWRGAICTGRRKASFLFTLRKLHIDFHLSSNKSLSNMARNVSCSKGRCSLMRELKTPFSSSPFVEKKREKGGKNKRVRKWHESILPVNCFHCVCDCS